MWSDAKNGGRESTVRLPPLIRVIADAFAAPTRYCFLVAASTVTRMVMVVVMRCCGGESSLPQKHQSAEEIQKCCNRVVCQQLK